MRTRVLALALLSPTWLVVPASAQESPAPSVSPTPARTVCPNIAFTSTREDQEGAPAGTPRTYTFSSDVQPAKVPDGWTLTRTSPGPVEVVDTRPSGGSATFTVAVSETTTFRVDTVGPEGCTSEGATFTRRVTPAPVSPGPLCGQVEAQTPETPPVAGQPVDLRVVVTRPFTGEGEIDLVRVTPRPSAVVRTRASDTATTETTFRITLGESHAFRLDTRQTEPCFLGEHSDAEVDVRVDVRPALSVAARRNAARDYTFSGRVLPARQQPVALYRVEADGRRVLTATTQVRPDGTYRLDRRFTGSGRFGFVTTVGATPAHLAGGSAVRPTVVH